MKSLVLILLLGVSFNSMAAYFKVVASSNPKLDTEKRTHIVVASRGNDLGYLPQLSSASRALKLVDIYPEDQVVVFIPVQSKTLPDEIKRMGMTQFTYKEDLLNSKQLMNELTVLKKIASFHTYGHGAIVEGIFLDAVGDKDVRWYPNDSQSKRLIGHFTDDAFATLNGCNAGHQLAPFLSKLWSIPVSGALVSTHFEVLYDDGNYYWFDEAKKKSFSKTTGDILSKSRSCHGACFRMKPDNGVYKGHYGKYTQGLPFFKMFCDGSSEEKCLKAMARSLISQNSTHIYTRDLMGREEYASLAREWLCPSGNYKSTLQLNCKRKLEEVSQASANDTLEAAALLYTPFWGVSAQCSFNSCYSKPICVTTFQQADKCAQGKPDVKESDTFVKEYLHYLKGYDLLLNEKGI